VPDLLARGVLMCPVSGLPLRPAPGGGAVETADGAWRYPVNERGVPILVRDWQSFQDYVKSNPSMTEEYGAYGAAAPPARFWHHHRWFGDDDRRTAASRRASDQVLALCDDPARLVLGVGGGPTRVHPAIINLNIDGFANVDVVGDACRLPFLDGSVDAVHCEAVLEHIADPRAAAAEMRRVMKPGALGFICTPFLQPFHGYPHHYQNFTHLGHRHLLEAQGFDIVDCGVAVGPGWTIAQMVDLYINTYSRPLARRLLAPLWHLFANLVIKPRDERLAEHDKAYLLASTTYVLVRR